MVGEWVFFLCWGVCVCVSNSRWADTVDGWTKKKKKCSCGTDKVTEDHSCHTWTIPDTIFSSLLVFFFSPPPPPLPSPVLAVVITAVSVPCIPPPPNLCRKHKQRRTNYYVHGSDGKSGRAAHFWRMGGGGGGWGGCMARPWQPLIKGAKWEVCKHPPVTDDQLILLLLSRLAFASLRDSRLGLCRCPHLHSHVGRRFWLRSRW